MTRTSDAAKITRLSAHTRSDGGAAATLAEEMGIGDEELARRKDILKFGPEDEENLKRLAPYARKYASLVTEEFYRHLLSFEEMRAFFPDPETLAYVKRRQTEYFIRLTEGNYDLAYVENRLLIGAIHERIGLPVSYYLSMYAFYQRRVAEQLTEIFKDDERAVFNTFLSLLKLIYLDQICAIETYIYRRERTIREQEEAIRELSTPVLRIRERLLILPIIGLIDAKRAMQITGQLLRAIRDTRARVVVIDITGVPVIDTSTANHLVQTVEAARLLGAHLITTGLSPEIAQTIVKLGVDLSRLNTVGDLQGGIEEAERILGDRGDRPREQPPGDQPAA